MPPKERTRRRLEDERLLVLLAGTETTARVLATAAFYIHQNKPLVTKLREELRTIMPTPTPVARGRYYLPRKPGISSPGACISLPPNVFNYY